MKRPKTQSGGWVFGWLALAMVSPLLRGADLTPIRSIADSHPEARTIARLFSDRPTLAATGLTKADYLKLIAGNVDFFKHCQDAAGAIIDPYEKFERQYSTPAFALDAAILAHEARRDDLLEPATRAMSFAVAALANHTTADNHADFYIPLLMHARRFLKDRVRADLLQSWDRQLRSIIPEKIYKDTGGGNNWNLVNVCGECLRRHDGLVTEDQLTPQQAYLDKSLTSQLKHFTSWGMFQDPNVPLAYDAFPRLWLEDIMADNAYAGEHFDQLRQTLALGSQSTLLLFSPSGEWISGGRSANHQWNEAQVAAISEINAAKWKAAGRDDLAGAFKRMAHLGLMSMRRWQRPSGELWIVKNRADPAERFGYETYSFHSQYNLLAMAMLAIAYERADDSIAEHQIPAEYGNYVLDLRENFHKVVAAAGGTYIVIDTKADPHYNTTGLQRIHQRGVELSPLSDSAAADRAYGPANLPKAALAPALQWRSADGTWHGVNDGAESCDLTGIETPPNAAGFTLRYTVSKISIVEKWNLQNGYVDCLMNLSADLAPEALRFVFPALVSDGAANTSVATDHGRLTVERAGGKLTIDAIQPAGTEFDLQGPAIPTHNGLVRSAVMQLPANSSAIHWRARLEPGP